MFNGNDPKYNDNPSQPWENLLEKSKFGDWMKSKFEKQLRLFYNEQTLQYRAIA
jgi:hypothetical protein